MQHDDDFLNRRQKNKERFNSPQEAQTEDWNERRVWFDKIYESANGDAALVPWADLAPKSYLIDWLKENPAPERGNKAIDIACGLGDNATALAENGWKTIGFDVAQKATDWAQKRFSHIPTDNLQFMQADLFDLPASWNEHFDLVHEVYTLQALKRTMRENAMKAILSLVRPNGGRLLIASRIREEGQDANGPPWPLLQSEIDAITNQGFRLLKSTIYNITRQDRVIPHYFAQFIKE